MQNLLGEKIQINFKRTLPAGIFLWGHFVLMIDQLWSLGKDFRPHHIKERIIAGDRRQLPPVPLLLRCYSVELCIGTFNTCATRTSSRRWALIGGRPPKVAPSSRGSALKSAMGHSFKGTELPTTFDNTYRKQALRCCPARPARAAADR